MSMLLIQQDKFLFVYKQKNELFLFNNKNKSYIVFIYDFQATI